MYFLGFYEEGNYRSNTVCSWTYIATPGKVVKLTFLNFDLEMDNLCNNDNLMVYDDTSLIIKVQLEMKLYYSVQIDSVKGSN